MYRKVIPLDIQIYVYVSILFSFFPIIVSYKTLYIVPCATQ